MNFKCTLLGLGLFFYSSFNTFASEKIDRSGEDFNANELFVIVELMNFDRSGMVERFNLPNLPFNSADFSYALPNHMVGTYLTSILPIPIDKIYFRTLKSLNYFEIDCARSAIFLAECLGMAMLSQGNEEINTYVDKFLAQLTFLVKGSGGSSLKQASLVRLALGRFLEFLTDYRTDKNGIQGLRHKYLELRWENFDDITPLYTNKLVNGIEYLASRLDSLGKRRNNWVSMIFEPHAYDGPNNLTMYELTKEKPEFVLHLLDLYGNKLSADALFFIMSAMRPVLLGEEAKIREAIDAKMRIANRKKQINFPNGVVARIGDSHPVRLRDLPTHFRRVFRKFYIIGSSKEYIADFVRFWHPAGWVCDGISLTCVGKY